MSISICERQLDGLRARLDVLRRRRSELRAVELRLSEFESAQRRAISRLRDGFTDVSAVDRLADSLAGVVGGRPAARAAEELAVASADVDREISQVEGQISDTNRRLRDLRTELLRLAV